MRKDGFIGMLESGMEKQAVPAVLPCFHLMNDKGSILKVHVKGDKSFKDDLVGQLLDPELVKAAWNKEGAHWSLSLATGEVLQASIVVSAIGMFNDLVYPEIDGIDDFDDHAVSNTDVTGIRLGPRAIDDHSATNESRS